MGGEPDVILMSYYDDNSELAFQNWTKTDGWFGTNGAAAWGSETQMFCLEPETDGTFTYCAALSDGIGEANVTLRYCNTISQKAVDVNVQVILRDEPIENNTDDLTITWSSDATDAQKSVLTNLVNNMVLVEGGTFMMGSDDEDADSDEQPVHSVTLTNDYYMGKFEVTHEEWIAVMYSDPGDDLPVKGVSWDDIVNYFLPELNRLTGLTFRLPTEAEWEFAARGGNNSNGYKYSGSNTIDDVAWYNSNSSGMTHAVGTKLPNELGIYDMSGNVWEWCSDWYSSGYYSSSPTLNPTGPATGSDRVLRGGNWSNYANHCRVSDRNFFNPDIRYDVIGFRLAL